MRGMLLFLSSQSSNSVPIYGCPQSSFLPVCTHGPASCHILALARLFDQVNQHLVRVHDLSSDLLSEFELYFLPSRYHITRGYPKCHTSSILTPNGKDNVQRMALRLVVLKLLVAWRDPLHELHRRFAVLEMSETVHKLRKGVERVMEKVHLPPGASLPTARSQEALSDYVLLCCFRCDSDKVQNYLKILKCTTMPEYGCSLAPLDSACALGT
uniref:Uncharacterized protein n=1 Tax=Electrophorus electricus TaxID=8005 RepID=A0A4W4HJG7_ELEEL